MNKFALLVVLVFASFVGIHFAWGHAALQGFTVTSTGPTNGLFTSVGTQGAPNRQYVDAVWPVTLNLDFLSTLPLNVVVNFPERASVTLTRTRSERRDPNGFLWTGRGGDCNAFLRNATVGFLGQIGCRNAGYEVSAVPGGSGLQLVRVIAPTGDTASDLAGLPPGESVQNQVQVVPATQVDTSIDLLVLYSKAVRLTLDPGGGNAATIQLVKDAVDQTQDVLNSSTYGFPTTTQTPIATVHLVAAEEVAYVDDGNFDHDLTYLATIDEPKTLRDFWAADVVMYLVVGGGTDISGLSHEPNYQGLPPPGGSGTTGYAPFASAALQYNCALLAVRPGPSCTDYYVFPHEFAHNFGANHDKPDSPWPNYPTSYMLPGPLEPYAFGRYGNPPGMEGGYRTIMAYTQRASLCQPPCTRIGYYSNPAVTTPDGFKTGQTGTTDNADVIQMFAPDTAQYRLSLGRIFYNGFEGVQ